MKTIAHKSLNTLLVGVIALAVVMLYGWLSNTPVTAPAHAQSTSGLFGYAWSDTIGWISMTCATGGPTGNNICATSNYSVAVDASGNLTGYAWSDNIGWIKFGGLSSFPSGSGTVAQNAEVSGTSIIGWARACAGTSSGTCSVMTSRTDGWDGWIALSGTGYGPTISGSTISGYAWGSDVVGWISFSGVTYGAAISPPVVTTYAQTGLGLTTATLEGGADPNGAATTGWFRYSTTNPGTCNDTFGTRAPSSGGDALGSGSTAVAFDHPLTGLNDSTTYYYCAIASNSGGTGVGAVRFFTTDSPVECADGIDNDGIEGIDLADPGCNGDPNDNSETNNPSLGTFTANKLRVISGESAILTWSGSELPASCTLSSSPTISGGTGTPRSVTSTPTGNSTGVTAGPISQNTIFTLTCGSESARITISVVPDVEEI